MPVVVFGRGPPRRRHAVLAAAAAAVACLVRPVSSAGEEEPLAALPPMGYNTWNDFECQLSDTKLLAAAGTLAKRGFAKLGYRYFVIDDCWMARRRDERGNLQPDPTSFPNGIAEVAKQVKALGFKFGIYTDRGPSTCVGRPASLGHEEGDAKLFASWGVDFVKNDGCWDPDCGMYNARIPGSGVCPRSGRRKAVEKYAKMATALRSTGRRVLQAVCGWQPWYGPVGSRIGQMWRVGADVRSWPGVYETTRVMEQLVQYSGPGGWSDPDMLLGSSAGAKLTLTPLQARAQFSLWSIMGAPLMLGLRVLNMSQYDYETYTNAEVIRINQDRLAKPGGLAYSTCPKYPRFNMSLAPDGLTPLFEVSDVPSVDSTSCGAHKARSCAECPQGHGSGWCNGDCKWENNACVLADASRPRPRLADRWDPWTLSSYRDPAMRRCHQVWTKPLSNGDLGVMAVNFADKPVELELPLRTVWPAWDGSAPVVARDLWAAEDSEAPLEAEWRVALPADGGHAVLRLHVVGAPAGSDAAGAGAGDPAGGDADPDTDADAVPDPSLVAMGDGLGMPAALGLAMAAVGCIAFSRRRLSGTARSLSGGGGKAT